MGTSQRSQTDSSGPQFVEYFEPVLEALRTLGGLARPAEVRDQVASALCVDEQTQNEQLPSGGSRYANRVAWARFYLAKAGLLDSSKRGVWALTEKGTAAKLRSHSDALALFSDVHSSFPRSQVESKSSAAEDEAPDDNGYAHADTRKRLMSVLRGLPVDGFERFCQRLLRESGFQDVEVTGKSGDSEIDGIGILQVNPLVSFKVLFQCKRYVGSVSPSQVRDFRGAMMGRADKGIVITTGTFTSEAKREALRDGVPPIELVDGEKLLDMLEELELGVRPVKAYEIDTPFFEAFES